MLVAEAARGVMLTAVNGAATSQGLRPGMTLADARALAPALVTRLAEPEADARALRRLALWCGRYGPASALDGSDGLCIDVTGATHLAGGELALIGALGRRLARCGLTARLGLADTPGAAAALARFGRRARIAAPGATQLALAALPVEALRLDTAATQLLRRLGLKQIGELAAVPRVSIERRFPRHAAGRHAAGAVLDRLDRVLGRSADPIRPLLPPPLYAVRADFPEPLIAEAGLQQALQCLAEALAERLAVAHAGARRLALTLYRSDASSAVVRVGLSRPSRSSAHMLMLLREKLGAIDAGFGIELMVLAARAVEPLGARQEDLTARDRPVAGQLDSWRDAGELIASLVDRLAGRLGEAAVFQLTPVASHLPERAQARAPAVLQSAGNPALWQTPRARPPRPAFLLDPPELIAVVAGLPDGPPARFRWRRCLREVTAAAGPERIAPEWWREISGPKPSRPRDYYAVEATDGSRYWVFRDGLYDRAPISMSANGDDDAGGVTHQRAPTWYLHGVFA